MSEFKKLHTMIDLECLGNAQDGVITSIGACNFNIETGETFGTFYKPLQWGLQMKQGKTVDPDTLLWWMSQEKQAQDHLRDSKAITLELALSEFESWLPAAPVVWGNGPVYDIGKLEFCYGLDNIPWNFRNVRCVRTIAAITKGLFDKIDVPFTGTKHNSLDDAIHQAQYVSAMYQAFEAAKKSYKKGSYEKVSLSGNDFGTQES